MSSYGARRRAFTLLELLIAITILSILMVFLYKSYASLNKSNQGLYEEVERMESMKLKKKTIFLDFSLAQVGSVKIEHQDKDRDILHLKTSNSIHRRFNPYVSYIFTHEKLYRLESLKPLSYPLDLSSEFDVDFLGEIKRFRVFESKDKRSYMVDIVFKNTQKILLKINLLNEL